MNCNALYLLYCENNHGNKYTENNMVVFNGGALYTYTTNTNIVHEYYMSVCF